MILVEAESFIVKRVPNMIREGLTFDDVLLLPQHSEVKSRSNIDVSVQLNKLQFKHPIIPANMSSVTGKEMALQVANSGGLAILHRFMTLEDQLDIVNDFVLMSKDGSPYYPYHIGVSVGVKEEDYENVKALHQLGAEIFCVDVAHGDSDQCVKMTRHIAKTYPNAFLISGNVATGSGAQRLWEAGADAVKVGVGPGSLCTTRIETGNGVPQLTALMDVFSTRAKITAPIHVNSSKPNYLFDRPLSIIADGGIKNAGDCVKALCFADMIMAGNIFAGCQEAPGKIHTINGVSYKEYVGSSTHKTNHIEGVEAWVPCKGTYKELLIKLLEGIRSGCSYQGAQNLSELKDNPTFIRITNAGLKESHPHDIILK